MNWITKIRILSLQLADQHEERAMRDYRDLVKELDKRSIQVVTS